MARYILLLEYCTISPFTHLPHHRNLLCLVRAHVPCSSSLLLISGVNVSMQVILVEVGHLPLT